MNYAHFVFQLKNSCYLMLVCGLKVFLKIKFILKPHEVAKTHQDTYRKFEEAGFKIKACNSLTPSPLYFCPRKSSDQLDFTNSASF